MSAPMIDACRGEPTRTDTPTPLSPPPSLVNVLVCTYCDHPLCGPEDILGPKIDIHPSVGFSYEFEDLLNINTDECEAPNCYRINVTSTTTLHTGEEPRRTRNIVGDRDGCPTSLVTDSASIVEEAIRFVEEINQVAARQREREALEDDALQCEGTGAPIDFSDASGTCEQSSTEGYINGSGADVTEDNNENRTSTSTPLTATQGQSISSASAIPMNLTIPETLTQEQSTRVDILRVKDSVCQYSVSPQLDEYESDDDSSGDRNSDSAIILPHKAITRDDTISPEMEWFPKYHREEKVMCAGCGMVLGWRFSLAPAKGVDGTSKKETSEEIDEESDTNSIEVGFGSSNGPIDEGRFVGLILRQVKQREWFARDISKQCMVARAIARREALVAMGGGDLQHLLPEHVRQGPQVLEEDVKARRQLDELTRSKLSQAVDERVAQYRVQATLLTSLLEKHKEQTSVLMQLLKGQREKLATLEGKIRTYDEIFIAQRQQLETQQRHIMFQDELMKTLRGQTATSQGQIEEQHRILKEQNSTITKQNSHMKDLQAYVKSMVTTQIRIKSHLEAMTRATSDQGGREEDEALMSPTEGDDANAPSRASPLTLARKREAIIATTAAKMLAEMAEHERAFVVDYSMSDSSGMPGSAGVSGASASSNIRNTPPTGSGGTTLD